jgi:hypothetical protein
MTLDDQRDLELIRLRAENAALRSEIQRLESALEQEHLHVQQLTGSATDWEMGLRA